jgi:hypothetical protein
MSRYLEPTPSNGELSAAQIDQWRTEGYAFVRGLLPQKLTDELARNAAAEFPAPGTDAASAFTNFGSQLVFPSNMACFNDVTLHHNLLNAIATLLGESVLDIRLSQSDLWPKYARPEKANDRDNSDQRIHVDYPNHTLTHPSPWSRPEAVEMILYLSDWEVTGGSTAIVPRKGTDDPAYRWPIVDSPGIGDLRYVNDREQAEAYFAEQRPALAAWRQTLYDRERYTRFKPGDIILYRHDTWHRGTPMTPGTLRLAHNLTYRRAASEWISTLHKGWAWAAYRESKTLEKLIATATLAQRAVLGFPQQGSDYWCDETLDAVEARYGMYGFDVAPYRR